MAGAGPLAGIRVVELSTMVTGSMSAMMLADQGADVVKVEPVAMGDPMRYIGAAKAGTSGLFANCNRGKRSLALDITSDRGRELLVDLAGSADVLVHNFRTGVMDRLGLGAETLRGANPRLVFAAVSGFGSTGPLATAGAYDHVVQPTAGFTAVQAAGGEPTHMRTLICDKVTAYTVCQAITAALFQRERTGQGATLELAMLDACLYFLWPDGFMNHTLLDDDVPPGPTIVDTYSVTPVADGFIVIAASLDKHWQGVFRALGVPELNDDPRFTSLLARMQHIDALRSTVLPLWAALPMAEALARLQAEDVPAAACLDLEGVIHQEQLAANGALAAVDHPHLGRLRVLNHPVRFDGAVLRHPRPCPLHGEHTAEVLGDLGVGADELAELRAAALAGGAPGA